MKPSRALTTVLTLGGLLLRCAAPQTREEPRAEPADVVTARPEDEDSDGDGVPNVSDVCPDRAEDCDRFEDEDGCPDLDDDRDAILDVCDACPLQPEVYGGGIILDGCPDQRAALREPELPAVTFRFARNATQWSPSIDPMVEPLVAYLRENPGLESLAIVGTASARERAPARLAQARADAVVQALVAAGIVGSRLTAHGVVVASGAGTVRAVALRWFGEELARWNGQAVEVVPRPERPVVSPPDPPACPDGTRPPPPAPPVGGCHLAVRPGGP